MRSGVTGVACAALFALASLFMIDATPAAGSVKFLSPRDGALKTSPAAEVKVKVRGPGKFTAFTSHPRNVYITRRFGRAAGGVRVARLRGRDLATGANHLYVHQRRAGKLVAADELHFTVGRERPGAIRVSGIHPREHGSVEVRVKPRGVGTIRARLNGRGASRAFVRRPGKPGSKRRRPWLASLALHHGLRHGRNTLVITGFNKRSGRYERVRRTFTVTHGRPLLTAGRDVRGSRRARIPLAGRARSAPGRTAHKLRWKITERPRGSKGKLVGASGGSPELIAHDTGHYTIEARASHQIRTGSTLTAPVAKDTVEATVQPAALPEGVPIQTIVSNSAPKVVVRSFDFPMGTSDCSQTSAPGWVQMVVLRRDTLSCHSTATYAATQFQDELLSQAIDALTSDVLVILSGGGDPNPYASVDNIQDAFNGLGGSTVSDDSEDLIGDIQAGRFSLVGVPGMNAGNAHQLVGDSLDGSSPAGAISGHLQLDSNNNYAFAWPVTNLTFDTSAPGSTGSQNLIKVGDQTFTGALSDNGFQLVWLDAVSGEPYRASNGLDPNVTYDVSTTGISDFQNQLNLLLDDERRTTVLIHSLNRPNIFPGQDAAPAWALAAIALAEFGANRYVFPGLDGSGGYSFVGAESLPENDGPNAGSEYAQSKTGSDTYLPGSDAARITGLLQRNEQGTLDSEVNSATPSEDPNPSDFEVTPILAQPDQPFDWDFSDRPPGLGISDQAIQDAQEFIVSAACDGTTLPCGGLELGGVVDPTFGIRALYWTQNFDPSTWQGAKDGFRDLNPTAARGCDTACQDAVDYLSGADAGFGGFQGLPTEFGQVARVVGYFEGGGSGSLRDELERAATAANTWFTSVSSEIISLYDPPPQPPSGPNVSGIIIGVLNLHAGLVGAVPIVGGTMSAPDKIAAAVMQIVQASQTTPGGLPANDPLVFNEDIKTWGGYVLNVFNGQIKTLSTISDLLVSDQGRLNDAARNISIPANTTDGSGNHSWQIPQDSDLSTRLAASVGRYLYASMMPVPAQAVLCDTEFPLTPDQIAAAGAYNASLVSDSGDGIEQRILGLANVTGDSPRGLDSDQVTTLFGQPPATGVPTPRGPQGFWKPTFMSEAGPAGTGGFTYAPDGSRAKPIFACEQ